MLTVSKTIIVMIVYSSISEIFAIFIICFCRPIFKAVSPCTGTDMRRLLPDFA